MQLHNRVVARFTDGRVLKGTTNDFSVSRDFFHVLPPEPGATPVRVLLAHLKALFFVKDHLGDKAYNEKKAFEKLVPGRKLQVTFRDGEVLVGSSTAYDAARPGFFLMPADPKSNNDRIYVVARAVRAVAFIP
jgi:small nuclear ribonucleoprotein (snRNP)-like protein